MKKFTYPPKFRPLSSSIIMVRPRESAPEGNSKFDYQILIVKRTANISFANVWAFPGGVVEK